MLSPAVLSFSPPRRRQAPTRGLSFWLLAALLVFSPLPFGSVYAVWPALYGVVVALAVVSFVLQRWHRERGITLPQPSVVAASALALGVILWGIVQSLPGLFPGLEHPAWAQTRRLLEYPELAGALSLVPERSLQVATHFLTFLVFAWLAFWLCRRGRNRELLLRLFIAAQTSYAVYGLVVYFAGFGSFLWFDDIGAANLVRSTFINRNNYATYVGLGTLAALALILRYLRQLASRETDQRARLRSFIEDVSTTGWLLVIAAVVCFLALLLSESRMGLVAFLAGLTVLLLGWSLRLPAGRTRTLGLALVSLPLMLLALNLLLSGDQTMARFAHLFENGDLRFEGYALMQEAIDERPLLGYGLGSFESAFRLVRDETIPAILRRGHNDYLELVMELGWPATIALLGAFGLLLGTALVMSAQRQEFELALLFVAATVQVGLHSLADFSMQMPAVVLAYLFLAGAAFGSAPLRPGQSH
ncbi:O-antigen ligase family protein [Lamprobacter modestohalophilus]|uniref:O-antigen ligase family protein n=1 Tax=Lamprobacter modestohalophilus TaxID=1064514 RepID=UPI002ADEFB74|nr:O-antigen ligase family protein [Lamprobacter modestohalophilus]MEA1048997.1 O-antigen ligase family protein [Lamprobacter modestohalophilus]